MEINLRSIVPFGLLVAGALLQGGATTPPAGWPIITSVLAYGAKCDGSTDDSEAFAAAIANIVDGGKLTIPACTSAYVINSASISSSGKNVNFVGDGWGTSVAAPFGNSQWLAAGAIKGSVIKVTGSHNGLDITGTNMTTGSTVSNLAIVGPGTGSSTGINIDGVYTKLSNVLIANFSTGHSWANISQGSTYAVLDSGNTIGELFATNSGNVKHYESLLQGNGTGISFGGGGGTDMRYWGGTVQSSGTVGININYPSAPGGGELSFDGMYFEANGTNLLVDTTNGSATMINFSNNRCADGLISFTKVAALNALQLIGNRCGSVTLTLPGGMGPVYVANNDFAGISNAASVALQSVDGNGNYPSRLTLNAVYGVPVLTSALPTCAVSGTAKYGLQVTDAVSPAVGSVLVGGGMPGVFAFVHCSPTSGNYIVDGI